MLDRARQRIPVRRGGAETSTDTGSGAGGGCIGLCTHRAVREPVRARVRGRRIDAEVGGRHRACAERVRLARDPAPAVRGDRRPSSSESSRGRGLGTVIEQRRRVRRPALSATFTARGVVPLGVSDADQQRRLTCARGRSSSSGSARGGHEHVTVETRRLASPRIRHRFLRTARHPSADLVADADVVRRRLRAAEHVSTTSTPRSSSGSSPPPPSTARCSTPCPARHSCSSAASPRCVPTSRVDVELLPAMSFLDVAWSRLGIDPSRPACASSTVTSSPPPPPANPARCSSPTHTPTGCCLRSSWPPTSSIRRRRSSSSRRSARPTSRSSTTTWADLDRTVDADHLTSLYIPSLAAPVGGRVRALPPARPHAARASVRGTASRPTPASSRT